MAAADDLDDCSGTVSLMTLHTAKGLEYEAVFLTGIEEGLLPHQMSASQPGGPAEERRLFYVGITRARTRLYLSLAMTRAQFGEVNVAMPSRYLQEIPAELIDWRQSPGMANSRNGTQPRALNARRGGFGASSHEAIEARGFGSGYAPGSSAPSATALARAARNAAKQKAPTTQWTNRVTGTVRDNGDLTLEAGDRIRHSDFGDGRVSAVTGVGPKRVAEVQFDTAGPQAAAHQAGAHREAVATSPLCDSATSSAFVARSPSEMQESWLPGGVKQCDPGPSVTKSPGISEGLGGSDG